MKFSGLKTIAFLEALKGAAALLLAIGIHILEGINLHVEVLKLLTHLHWNADGHYAQMLLHAVDGLTHSSFTLVTVIAVFYALVRFVEAYGLWHEMRWTEWFAFLSGAVYLPFEFYEIIKDPNLVTGAVLGINLIVVAYMYTILKKHPDGKKHPGGKKHPDGKSQRLVEE